MDVTRRVRVRMKPVDMEDTEGRSVGSPGYVFEITYPTGMALFAASTVEALYGGDDRILPLLDGINTADPPVSESSPIRMSAMTGDGAPVDVSLSVRPDAGKRNMVMRRRAYANAIISLTVKDVLDSLADAIIRDGASVGDMSVRRGIRDDRIEHAG